MHPILPRLSGVTFDGYLISLATQHGPPNRYLVVGDEVSPPMIEAFLGLSALTRLGEGVEGLGHGRAAGRG